MNCGLMIFVSGRLKGDGSVAVAPTETSLERPIAAFEHTVDGLTVQFTEYIIR